MFYSSNEILLNWCIYVNCFWSKHYGSLLPLINRVIEFDWSLKCIEKPFMLRAQDAKIMRFTIRIIFASCALKINLLLNCIIDSAFSV